MPLSYIYISVIKIKRVLAKKIKYPIKIVSVGNIVIGGSGKTPFTISLTRDLENPTIILRGFGRESKGLFVISRSGKILENVKTSGDEAMLLASSLPNANVIVSENRDIAIKKAIELDSKVVILDDGFSKYHIDKFEIILMPNIENRRYFTLPSGYLREPESSLKYANLILHENIEYKREVTLINPTEKMILITAISNPKRLDKYLPKNIVKKVYFLDHSYFDRDEILELVKKYKATSILTTEKDLVKLKDLDIKISLLKLNIVISNEAKEEIESYLAK